MPKISKTYKTLKAAEAYHTRLANKWHYVRLVQSPRFTESGVYVWDVATIEDRLEHLRRQLRAERISMDELGELQGLADHIQPGDVELAEAAGIPEEEFRPGGLTVPGQARRHRHNGGQP